MKDTKLKYDIGEVEQSASQSSQLVDEIAEKKRNQKKSLIKLGAMGVLIVVTIIIGSLSWFTANRDVETSGMGMKTATLPFDIATKGASVRNSAVMNAQKPEYTEGASGTYSDVNNSEGTYYVGDSLLLRFDPARQDDPKTAEDESIPPDISPGSSGELSLYVIPKTNESQKVKVSMNVVAFAEIEKKDGNGDTVYKMDSNDQFILDSSGNKIVDTEIIEITNAADFITKANAVNNSTTAGEADKYIAAVNYLKGHILSFGEEGDPDNSDESLRYYYSTPYTTSNEDSQITFNYPVPANKNGKAVQVPIYWMWTNTLGQILLPDNTSGQRSGYPILADTDDSGKAAIKTYMISNRSDIFTNNDGNTISRINSVAQTVTSADFNSDAFKYLSSGYNEADYIIGTKIAYFMIDVTVEPVS